MLLVTSEMWNGVRPELELRNTGPEWWRAETAHCIASSLIIASVIPASRHEESKLFARVRIWGEWTVYTWPSELWPGGRRHSGETRVTTGHHSPRRDKECRRHYHEHWGSRQLCHRHGMCVGADTERQRLAGAGAPHTPQTWLRARGWSWGHNRCHAVTIGWTSGASHSHSSATRAICARLSPDGLPPWNQWVMGGWGQSQPKSFVFSLWTPDSGLTMLMKYGLDKSQR